MIGYDECIGLFDLKSQNIKTWQIIDQWRSVANIGNLEPGFHPNVYLYLQPLWFKARY